MLKIKEIKIENYKCLKDIHIVNLGDLNVFIGRNNSGKSSILEAIGLFLIPESSAEKYMFFKKKDGDSMNQLSVACLFEIPKFVIEGWKKTLQPAVFEVVDKYCRDIWVIRLINGSRSEPKYHFQGFQYELELQKYPHFQGQINEIRAQVSNGWRSLIGFDSPKVSIVKAGYRNIRSDRFKRPKGESHTIEAQLHGLKDGPRRRYYEDFIRELANLDSSFPKIDIRQGNQIFAVIGEKKDGTMIDLPFNVEGSGHQDVAALYWAICNQDDEFLLIDEPENFKHPSLQRKIFDILVQRAEQKQIFISTQSPVFSQPGERRAIYLVNNLGEDAGSAISRISPNDFRLIKQEIGIRNSDFFSAEMVLIVEGDTEEKALPIISEALEKNFGYLGIELINVCGSSKVKVERLKEFFDLLSRIDTTPYIFLDNDELVKKEKNKFLKRYSNILKDDQFVIWEGDFENNFTDKQLYKALNKLFAQYDKKMNISLKDFSEERKRISSSKISSFLEKIFAEVCKCHRSLFPKPKFGILLGEMIAKEIHTKTDRSKTRVEKELEKLFDFYKRRKV